MVEHHLAHYRYTHRESEGVRETASHLHTYIQAHTLIEIESDKHPHREREKQTYTHTERGTHPGRQT